MNHSWKTRVLSMVLAVVMVIGLVPMNAFGTEAEAENTTPVTDSGAEVITLDTNSANGTAEESVETYGVNGSSGIDYNPNSSESTDNYYNLISKKDWEIAPGIAESQIVLNNSDGSQRQVLFVMEADLSNEYVKVINSYTGMVPQYGNYQVSGMSNQAAIAEEMGYGNVVGAMNTTLSWYTGYAADRINEPLGFIMLDADILFDPANCGYTYGNVGFPSVLVINKDFDEEGNPRPADIPKVEMPQIRSAADLDGWEDQVIPCSSGYILKDGVNQSNPSHTGGAPRSVVGFKPDGTVVIMVNDGRQSPYSAGMSMYELAEVMLDLGCTYAVNCDGGGSTTWVSQRPGEELKINNSPSDGAERSTTTGILFISTAPATGEFVRANITTDSEYYVPGSTVKFEALGTDLVGTAADIPEDVYWQIQEDGMGTIEDGIFVSNGTVGTVTAQMVYNDTVVGEKAIQVTLPEAFAFTSAAITVPFDKTVTIGLTATINDGRNEVTFTEADVELTTTNAALGTFDGFSFTSVSEENAPEDLTSILTAALKGTDLVATVPLSLGKGTEVIEDFENGVSTWNVGCVNNAGTNFNIAGADVETGEVHDGEHSLKFNINGLNFDNTAGSYKQVAIYPEEDIIIENAKSIGAWIYIPDEFYNLWIRFHYYYEGADGTYTKKNTVPVLNQPSVYNDINESGWYYFSVDVSAYNSIMIKGGDTLGTNEAKNCRFIEFNACHMATNDIWTTINGTLNGDYTIYVDSICADFSEAVDDREAPVFGDVSLMGVESETKMENHSVVATTSNVLNIAAKVSENTTKSNATGLNTNSAKAYVDGVLVDSTYSNGRISIANVAVADGVHRVKFEISDNAGNKSVVVRLVEVNSGVAASTIKVAPKDAALDRLYGGSVYWMDLTATDIETIQSVETVIDLNSSNHWELDHMELVAGFTATYSVDDETNTAKIMINRTGSNAQTGEAVLASLPIRVIYYDTDINLEGYTAETYWKDYNFWSHDVKVDVDLGKITYVADYTSDVLNTFSNEEFSVDTEWYTSGLKTDATYKAEHATAHVHTAAVMDDKAATCTEDGYTGRTYCEVCASVVEWGTTAEATGHSYDFVEDVLQCVCGELFTGIHTDGIEYVDGVALSGWVGDSYYANGEKLTGIQKVTAPDSEDEFYYDFGEDGVCENKTKYTGIFQDGQVYRYAYLGVLTSGWQNIDEEWYYFSSSTMANVSGVYEIGGVTYEFEENGKLTTGVWVNAFNGYRYYYGPSYYIWAWWEIDGEWYYFQDGVRLTGYQYVALNGEPRKFRWHYFDENGVSQGLANGMGTSADGTRYYFEDGKSVSGLRYVDGEYYCFISGGNVVRSQKYYVWETYCDLPEGTYEFGADGKLVNGLVQKDDGVYFYTLGQTGQTVGLTQIGEDYYFIDYDGKCATGKLHAWATNCDLPIGTYEFGADGKMLNGIVEKEEGTYYYTLGSVGQVVGLIQVDDYYYFVDYSGKCATGKQYVWATNCDLQIGHYEFGENGKMLNGIVECEDGIYYYTKGNARKERTTVGMTKVGEDYYFVDYDGKCLTGKLYVWATNCELPVGTYEFAADGKLLNGIVEKEDGIYYYTLGKVGGTVGLTQVGDDYYFIEYSGLCCTGKLYAWRTNCDLPCETYLFGEDGKLLNGIVEQEDGIYYYTYGKVGKTVGLTRVGEDYYFVDYDGTCATGKMYVWKTSCDLPVGHYEFSEDGKLLNGIVSKNGKLYCYVLGAVGETVGLTKIGEDYYFVDYDGTCATGKLYAWATNCDLPVGNYEFDENGKALDGFETKDGVLYYYVNGQPGTVGINFIDGYYYFVDYGGKLIVNCSYYVWEGNGILAQDTYKFNEQGRIVG